MKPNACGSENARPPLQAAARSRAGQATGRSFLIHTEMMGTRGLILPREKATLSMSDEKKLPDDELDKVSGGTGVHELGQRPNPTGAPDRPTGGRPEDPRPTEPKITPL